MIMTQTKTKKLTLCAMFMALTCIATMFFNVRSATGYTNLGDAFVLLGAFTLGPVYGFVCGGVGSALADLLLGYAYYIPGTLLIKGGMAVIAALLLRCARGGKKAEFGFQFLGALLAEAWMVFSYWLYKTLLLNQGAAALASVPKNILQGVVGLVLALLLNQLICRIPFVKGAKAHE